QLMVRLVWCGAESAGGAARFGLKGQIVERFGQARRRTERGVTRNHAEQRLRQEVLIHDAGLDLLFDGGQESDATILEPTLKRDVPGAFLFWAVLPHIEHTYVLRQGEPEIDKGLQVEAIDA